MTTPKIKHAWLWDCSIERSFRARFDWSKYNQNPNFSQNPIPKTQSSNPTHRNYEWKSLYIEKSMAIDGKTE